MDDDAPGVPEWVVTYGDMMSLLLTFFIMLVSLSEVVADKKYRAVLSALQEYVGYQHGPVAPPGQSFPLNATIERLQALGSFTNLEKGRGGVKRKARPGPDVRVFRSPEGRPIGLGAGLKFEPNGTLTANSTAALKVQITEAIGKPNKIEIRHPIAQFNDAEEATAYARASTVYDLLVEGGIDAERLRITLTPRSGDASASNAVSLFALDTTVEEYQGPRDPIGRTPTTRTVGPAPPAE